MSADVRPVEENRTAARRTVEAIAGPDVETIEALVDEDLLHHALGVDSTKRGRDVWLARIRELNDAFPDLRVEVEDVVAEDDRVVCRVRTTGTFTRPFDGQAPSGKAGSMAGFHALRFEDGRVVEWWRLNNVLGWGREIDALPLGPGALARVALRQLRWKLGGR